MNKHFFSRKTLPVFLLSGMMCSVPIFEARAEKPEMNIVQQAKVKISGTVLDETGLTVPGAAILIQGSTQGVTTDLDGKFTIEVKSGSKLEFSYVGYETQVITISSPNTSLVIKLIPQRNELDEVTVVAFAKQKKESVIASVSTIKPAELKVPSSNLTTALAGRLSGLVAYQRSGEPGQDDANFFVRGVTTLSYASSPLILIDGVEMSSYDLARLQPDDIASFSIMKDATATALYGARGGNGVILVTTKEGKEGAASISVRYETSMSMATDNIDLVDPITYMKMNNEAALTRDKMAVLPYSMEHIEAAMAGKNKLVYPTMDWRNALLKKSTTNHRVNFNLSGGGKVARYYVAGTFNQDNGLLKVDKRNKFNNNIDLKNYLLRTNVNINVTKSTEVIARMHGSFSDYSGPLDGGSSIYNKIMRTDPAAYPAYYEPDVNNEFTQHILFGNMDDGQYINPYADLVKGYKEYSKTTMMTQFEIKQKLDFITKGLNLRGLFSTKRYSYYEVSRSYNPFYYNIESYDKRNDVYTLNCINPKGGTEYLNYSPNENKTVEATTYGELAIDYNREFGIHGVSGLLVGTLRNSQTGGASTLTASLPHRNAGLSGRFTYSFDKRYFAEFNFGYNGSERFAENERFGFFPSFGVGYIVSNEKFFPDSWKKGLNMLKLKATYGIVGNDAIGESDHRFFYLSEVNMDDKNAGYTWGEEYGYTVEGITIKKYPNALITWEKSKKMNIGLEARLFDMIDLNVDYYTDERNNILQTREYMPIDMGLVATPKSNIGIARGSGIDASADISKSITKDWWFTGRINFTYATTEWVHFEEVDRSQNPWLTKKGTSLHAAWGLIAERLFVDDEEVANSPKQTFGTYGAGDIKYKDINNDGVIDFYDRVEIGYPTRPEIIYGFGFSTGYKGLDFSCFFQGMGRESFFIDANKTAPFIDTDGNGKINSKNQMMQAYADSHWSEENRDIYALWPRLSTVSMSNNTQQSTWWMRDGSFLRLKSLEIGYTLPKNWLKKIYARNVRVYASGTNLLTFSKFKLWDPEMAGSGLNYPTQRVINAGIQVQF